MHGVDVSNNNFHHGKMVVDWTGVEFAMLKVSEGVVFTDGKLPDFRAVCDQRGIPWGTYHFAQPDVSSAKAEAEFFLARAPKAVLPPALDFETRDHGKINPLKIIGVTAAAAWIDEWCDRVQQKMNQTPFFYSFRDYSTQLLPLIKPWPLWLATAQGKPNTFKTFAGRQVAIEQWGQQEIKVAEEVFEVDLNESYVDLAGFPKREDDMTPGNCTTREGDRHVFSVRISDGAIFEVILQAGADKWIGPQQVMNGRVPALAASGVDAVADGDRIDLYVTAAHGAERQLWHGRRETAEATWNWQQLPGSYA
jgi:hypothetical protein